MIKETFEIEKKEKQDFKPLPENIYQVQLLDIEVATRPTYDTRLKPDSEKIMEKVLKFQFTLLGGKDTDGSSLRGRNVWENFVPTYLYEGKNGKNKLYQITEALLGRSLTQKDEAEMDSTFLNNLIGSQCRVGIKNKKSGDKSYSNIETYYAIEQEMPSLTDEEKEKASVKKDDKETDTDFEELAGEEIVDEVGF